MPFTTPLREYQSGDLLYGLAGPRGILASTFNLDPRDIYTIDQYDIFADARHPSIARNGLRHDPAFIDILQKSAKTAPIVGLDLNDDAIWNFDRVGAGAAARRKCKSGIEYICRQTSHHIHFCLDGINLVQVAQKTFPSDTPGGQAQGIDWHRKARSITGAELRRLYRLRYDNDIRIRVQFWKLDGMWKQCPPPWDDNEQSRDVHNAFAAYIPNMDPMDST